MTIYTATFQTPTHFAERAIAAGSAAEALAQARALFDNDPLALYWQSYAFDRQLDEISIADDDETVLVGWQSQELSLRLVAPELLEPLAQALTALNTAVRFPVPDLLSNSYKIAALCDRAIAKAKGGAA